MAEVVEDACAVAEGRRGRTGGRDRRPCGSGREWDRPEVVLAFAPEDDEAIVLRVVEQCRTGSIARGRARDRDRRSRRSARERELPDVVRGRAVVEERA